LFQQNRFRSSRLSQMNSPTSADSGFLVPFYGLFTFSRPSRPSRTFVLAVSDEYLRTARFGLPCGKSADSRPA
ncbi:hypothetical protein KI387_014467, partial [Taxus chinensis]